MVGGVEQDAAEMIPVLVGVDIVTGEFPLLPSPHPPPSSPILVVVVVVVVVVDAEDFVGPISSMMLFI